MKSIKYLFVMVFVALLSVSCNSDDDSGNTNALVGTWRVTEIVDGEEIKVTATFNANNSGTMVIVSTFEGETETETDNFTWSTSGNKLTVTTSSGEPEISTYTINGNKLTITDEDGFTLVLTKL